MSTEPLLPHNRLAFPGPSQWVVYGLFASMLYAAYSYLSFASARRKGLPLPPGPAPWPIIGNLLDVPNRDLGANYAKISQKYGDIARLSVFGTTLIVVNSYEAAHSLLERRSGTTSDRQAPMMAHLTGYATWEFATFGYGQEWRRHRRAFHEHFHRGEVVNYQALLQEQTRAFLKRLLATPHDFVSHIRYLFGATILQAVYGITVAEENDHFIALVERGVHILVRVMTPRRYLVDAIPALRHVPAWLPGAGFQRLAAEWKQFGEVVRDEPFRAAVAQMEDGPGKPYMVARMLEKSAHKNGGVASQEVTQLARDVSAVAYLGGADTTFSSLQAFFLAMALYPAVQKKAQAELDAVVGPARLPTFADRAQLPYTNAIVTEVLRWLSIAPVSVPHRTTQDEELDGFLIPKGSVILANVWAMSRDPEVYPEPEEFRPERFLRDGAPDPAVRDSRKFAFGFGRRACPGEHFADNSLFIVIASVLHAFDIAPPLDAHGRPVPLAARWTTELSVVYPAPFECRITPRSELARELVVNGTEE